MKKPNKETNDIAEKLALQEFDNSKQTHEFSAEYKQKKQDFLNQLPSQNKKRWSNQQLAMAAILALILIPTTVYAATEIYQWLVQKDGYQLDLSFKQEKIYAHDKFYKLDIGYLPEGMGGSTESNKYSFTDSPAQGGLSFLLWEVTKKADFTVLSTKDYEEMTFANHPAIVVKKETIDNKNPKNFDTIVYVLFEEEGYVLQAYVGNDVSKEEWEKVFNHVSLTKTTKEHATYATSFDDYKKRLETEDKPTRNDTGFLSKDSSTLHSIGDTVTAYSPDESSFEFTINKMVVLDNIKDLDPANFNSYMLEVLNEEKLLTDDKAFIPFNQQLIEPGNGIDTIDRVVDERGNNIKFVYLTATVENTNNKPLKDLYFQSGIMLLNKEKKGWVESKEIVDFSSHSGEVDYLDSHGKGDSFYRMPDFSPKEKREFHFGYFVDETQLDNLFIPVFNYSGIENLNQKELLWFDIRP